ncbi:MAG: PDZ domain-containing protein [Candidatus Dormibacteraeota bacterium]|nr:PDZ domain-containing protein [Candidatus Dormibacteraeota bacterium]
MRLPGPDATNLRARRSARTTWARRTAGALLAVLLLCVAFAAGAFTDQRFPEVVPVIGGGQSRAQLDEASQQQALRIIQAHYWDQDLNGRSLTDGSIQGMVQSLNDPFTSYLTPAEYRAEQRDYAGQHHEQIGIFLDYSGPNPVITGIVPGSPAQKAGIEAGDAILRVDGRSTAGVASTTVGSWIDGSGARVSLLLQRGARQLTVPVTPGAFSSPTVVSAKLPGDVLYIRIYEFGDSTAQEFTQQLRSGLPAKGIVLDLRGNGGGYVSAAVTVVSSFVSKGEVFSTKGRGVVHRTDVSGNVIAPRTPLVVLVDGNTASASEITSGSLLVHGRARLVGERTYGKGSEQEDYPLSNGGDLHLTVMHWYLPNGKWIGNHKGIQPNRVVALPKPWDMYDVATPQRSGRQDTQLQAALAMLP